MDGPYAIKSELDPLYRTRCHRKHFSYFVVPYVKVIRNMEDSGLVQRMWFIRTSKDLGDVLSNLLVHVVIIKSINI